MSASALQRFLSEEPASYEDLRNSYLSFFSLSAGVLTIILVMAGTLLDWFYYRDHWAQFFAARVVCSIAVGLLVIAARIKKSNRFTENSTVLWVTFPQAMICYMIASTGGVDSIYFVGLAYAFIGLAVFLPLKLSQASLFTLMTAGMYLLACFIGTPGGMFKSALGGHLVFLSFFGIIMFAVTVYAEKWRVHLFHMQAQIRGQRDDLAQTNRQLAEAKVKIAQSEKMASLGTMAAGLLHEMNNPVNYSQIALKLAADDIAAGDLASAKSSIDDAALGVKRLGGIIADLRHVAYQSPEGADKADGRFRLSEVVRIATRLTMHLCKGFEVYVAVDPEVKVRGDSPSIVSVLVNLIENAAHSIREAKRGPLGRIEIRAASSERAGWLRVSVRDNGVGLRPDIAERIFEPFFTTKQVHEGMGLGLSISYAMVRRHGSELTVTATGEGVCELSFLLEVIEDEPGGRVVGGAAGADSGSAVDAV